MIITGTCVPTPGLFQRYGVYACATGVLWPQVLVDPMVRTKPGEQALVAHEMAHVEQKHALQFVVLLGIIVFLSALNLLFALAMNAKAMRWDPCTLYTLMGAVIFLVVNIPFFLRMCEVDADEYALSRTSPKEFVQFLYLHPHPKGRWGRWLYGSSIEARIQRVLPR